MIAVADLSSTSATSMSWTLTGYPVLALKIGGAGPDSPASGRLIRPQQRERDNALHFRSGLGREHGPEQGEKAEAHSYQVFGAHTRRTRAYRALRR